ncbi:MAG: hypothetical protein SO253_02755 [Bacilli bacterium]|nr:hypothetical protein [Bacilli bacterium]
MRIYLNEFFADNLFAIIVVAFFLCYFALKYKSIKRVFVLIFVTLIGFASIAMLYKLGIVSVDFYIYTCNVIVKICTILENISVSSGEALYRIFYRIIPTFTFFTFYNSLFLHNINRDIMQNIKGLVVQLDYQFDLKKDVITKLKNIVIHTKNIQSTSMILLC